MKVVYTEEALKDLDEIADWLIATIPPSRHPWNDVFARL
jgi:plasmid stabilization system protein ParE